MSHVHVISILHRFCIIAFFKINIFKFCLEGCMTAMIRPICIKHTNLCHCRVTFFFAHIIFLDKFKIIKSHRQSQRIIELFQLPFRHGHETLKYSHIRRLFKFSNQCLRFCLSGLSRIHRIDTEGFNTLQFFRCHCPL